MHERRLSEIAFVSGGFEDLSDSELPAQQRAAAGHYRQRHDHFTYAGVNIWNARPNGAVEFAGSMFGTIRQSR